MKIINWGLIGCGDIVERRVAPALKELDNCRITAVNRADYSKAESFARKFGTDKYYKTYSELIKDTEIDAVYIATPVYLHAEQTINAAENGKHILCEKPMGMNSKECRKMIDACRKNKVKLGIAYYRHFYPSIIMIKEIIKKGEIGIMALRAADVVGDHTVLFGGPGERIEFTHRSNSRKHYATGALMAARFLADKESGFFTMADVLGLQ